MKVSHLKREHSAQVKEFIERTVKLLTAMHIADPPLRMEMTALGGRESYSGLRHDPVDGFVKAKEAVWVLTGEITRGGEVLVKGLVVPSQYEFIK